MKPASLGKYRAKPACGFPSRLESAVYDMLKAREADGEIRTIRRQHQVTLQDGGRDLAIRWYVDFTFERVSDGQLVYVEAKGFKTETYSIKLRLFKGKKIGPLEVWGGDYRRPRLLEKFEPELGDVKNAG